MKRKVLLLFTIVFLFLPVSMVYSENGFDVFVSDSAKGEIVLDFEIDRFSLKDVEKNGVTYSSINFPVKVTTMEKGYAQLPFVHASVVLPDDGVVSAEVILQDFKDTKLSHPLVPSRGVIYRNQEPSKIPFKTAAESIVDGWYPLKTAKISDPYILRSIRGANVYVYPFQYNAKQRVLRSYSKIRVKIKIDKAVSFNPLMKKERCIPASMNSLYNDLFVNYEPQRILPEYGELLVVYTSRHESAIKPYIEWKKQKGFKVHTAKVLRGTNVKKTILEKYSKNPSILYVQLVGDWADIRSDRGTLARAPMDPMLGCVAGSDNVPDLIVGRFSSSLAEDIALQSNKAINYEKKLNGPMLSFKGALGIGSGEGSGSGDDGEADYEHINVIKENKLLPKIFFGVDEIYKSGTPSDVINSVNQELFLINYCGHGSATSWGTTGFSNKDIESLTNERRLPVIISVACLNGKFHGVQDCFAEAWLNKDKGGAAAVLMSTINQPWQPPMRGQDYMNDLLTGGYDYTNNPGTGISSTEGRTTFGSIVFSGLALMLAESSGSSDLDTIKTWTIFGDSSLQVRTGHAKPVSLTNKNYSPGSPFETKIEYANGEGVKGAMVSLGQNGVYFNGITDDSGNIRIDHDFTEGHLKLTVSGFNLKTNIVNIDPEGYINQPPVAAFDYFTNGLETIFVNKSRDFDGKIVHSSWNNGDGFYFFEFGEPKVHTYKYAEAGIYKVELRTWDEDGDMGTYTKEIKVSHEPSVIEVSNGDSVNDILVPEGKWKFYRINIPEKVLYLNVKTKGGAGNADLYLKHSGFPTETDFDKRSQIKGNQELCIKAFPEEGDWYIGILAEKEFSGVTLKVSHN